jgi:SAM-dependent methyltransferase
MYMPEPERALGEMRRVLRPGGRVALAVWGDRSRCGWASLFDIVRAEVASDVCPLFFRLGLSTELERACREARFDAVEQRIVSTTLGYVDAEEACRAAFIGGPVALGWSRFDEPTRARVSAAYTDSIAKFRAAEGYEVPAEFVVVGASAAAGPGT